MNETSVTCVRPSTASSVTGIATIAISSGTNASAEAKTKTSTASAPTPATSVSDRKEGRAVVGSRLHRAAATAR